MATTSSDYLKTLDKSELSFIESATAEYDLLHNDYEDKIKEVQIDLRQNVEKKLKKRQPLLEAEIKNSDSSIEKDDKDMKPASSSWGEIFRDPKGPLAEFLNATTDPKIIRYINSFNVETRVVDGDGGDKKKRRILRKVLIRLDKANPFIENEELYREVDDSPQFNTTACSGVRWREEEKGGSENSRKNSLFMFFDAKPGPVVPLAEGKSKDGTSKDVGGNRISDNVELLNEILSAFDQTFQDPFNEAASDNEEKSEGEEGEESEEGEEDDDLEQVEEDDEEEEDEEEEEEEGAGID